MEVSALGGIIDTYEKELQFMFQMETNIMGLALQEYR